MEKSIVSATLNGNAIDLANMNGKYTDEHRIDALSTLLRGKLPIIVLTITNEDEVDESALNSWSESIRKASGTNLLRRVNEVKDDYTVIAELDDGSTYKFESIVLYKLKYNNPKSYILIPAKITPQQG